MLTLLMGGRAATAKELAYGSGVSPATATAHLKRLIAENLVVARSQGRHKYFNLASAEAARCVESLMCLAESSVSKTLRNTAPQPLRDARFCYDHLAGKLGTGIAQHLVRRALVVESLGDFDVTEAGTKWFSARGIDIDRLKSARRQFAPACLDWSERRDHIGGALGAAIADLLLAQRWIRRLPHSREVRVTPRGETALRDWR